MSEYTKEQMESLKEQMIAEMEVLMELMNQGDFKAVVSKMEDLDVSKNLDISLTYLNTVAMCYEKIEESYCSFYARVYEAFEKAYGQDRAENILSTRRPAIMDEEYKNPSLTQQFLTSASDQIFGLNIERGTSS
jgi:hypothetical protein